MSRYSIAQAKTNLSRLVDEVLEGKDVTITRHGKPVVELKQVMPAGRPMSKETLDMLRACRESLPEYKGDLVADIRAMRDDF